MARWRVDASGHGAFVGTCVGEVWRDVSWGSPRFFEAYQTEEHATTRTFQSLRVKGCNKHGGQFRQKINVADNTVKYESFVNDKLTGDCLTLMSGGSEFGISTYQPVRRVREEDRNQCIDQRVAEQQRT